MKNQMKVITTALLLLFSLSAHTQVIPDTLHQGDQQRMAGLLDRLDSLYIRWLKTYQVLPAFQDTSGMVESYRDWIELPDSVIREQLKTIPSAIPLTFNTQVRSYLDLYTKKRRNQLRMMLGLAEYYFPNIEAALDSHDLPLELKYMPIIESALNPVARSRVGAQGLWQFMYGTARFYKLTVNSFIDERLDPAASTEAACLYLKDLYAMYHDWHLVIAAYNCGPGNVNKAIRRAGGKSNYWDIYYYLPRETRGYVPSFIAATYVMNFASEYGVSPLKPEIPLLVDTIQIHEEVHFGQVSNVLGIPVATLTMLNPKYRKQIVPAAGGPYELVLPVEIVTSFIDYQDSIFAFNDAKYFSQANLERSPSTNRQAAPPPAGDYIGLTYTVKSGDNLGFIAGWYQVGVTTLKDWNNLYSNTIRDGQKLVVYVPRSKSEEMEGINDMSFAEKQALVGKVVVTEPVSGVIAQVVNGGYVNYTVRSGDNLWSIARKFPGVSNDDIMRLNNMANSSIQPGQILKIKRKEG